MRQERNLTAGISGLVFSVGLNVSQMVNPEKVLNFLDFSGNWDPSLAFVMAGALMVYFTGFRLIQRRHPVPMFETRYHLPGKSKLDKRLLSGAALFGIGWGVAGICPGPALASAVNGSASVLAFIVCMLGGMWLVGQADRYQQRRKNRAIEAEAARKARLDQLERSSRHELDNGVC